MCHQKWSDKNFSEIITSGFEKDLGFTLIFSRTFLNMNKSNKPLKVSKTICSMSAPMNNIGNASIFV